MVNIYRAGARSVHGRSRVGLDVSGPQQQFGEPGVLGGPQTEHEGAQQHAVTGSLDTAPRQAGHVRRQLANTEDRPEIYNVKSLFSCFCI